MFALCKPRRLSKWCSPSVAKAKGRLAGALRGLGNPQIGDRVTRSHKMKGVVPFPALAPMKPAQLWSLGLGHRPGSTQPEVPGPPGSFRRRMCFGLTSHVFVRTRKPLCWRGNLYLFLPLFHIYVHTPGASGVWS